jgi:SAM-dependent methyltransferase
MTSPSGSLSEYFDGWYADKTATTVVDEIHRRHLGLPPHLLSTSAVPWDGVGDLVAGLRLAPGAVVVDLACGRGSYGLEIAARTGARLIGIDFSAEAVRQAAGQARRLKAEADFRVGDLMATGLDSGSADGVLCLDSIQFAPEPAAAYGEIARILVPGGRVVLTCWEPADRDDPRVLGRLRTVGLQAGLTAAGFSEVEVTERADWRAGERGMWEEAVALDPGDDAAVQSFRDEGVRTLESFGLYRRVFATATAPAA